MAKDQSQDTVRHNRVLLAAFLLFRLLKRRFVLPKHLITIECDTCVISSSRARDDKVSKRSLTTVQGLERSSRGPCDSDVVGGLVVEVLRVLHGRSEVHGIILRLRLLQALVESHRDVGGVLLHRGKAFPKSFFHLLYVLVSVLEELHGQTLEDHVILSQSARFIT